MENKLQRALNSRPKILISDPKVIEKGMFMLRYRGCVIVKDNRKDFDSKGRYMDFLIPGREHGLIDIKLSSLRNSINRRIGMEKCVEDDLHPGEDYPFNLTIKVRNIVFFNAMLFTWYEGDLYKFMDDDGMGHLQVNNDTFYSIWNQLVKPREIYG